MNKPKRTEQEKCQTVWSTPFHRVWSVTQSSTPVWTPYEFVDASVSFLFGLFINSDVFHWKKKLYLVQTFFCNSIYIYKHISETSSVSPHELTKYDIGGPIYRAKNELKTKKKKTV